MKKLLYVLSVVIMVCYLTACGNRPMIDIDSPEDTSSNTEDIIKIDLDDETDSEEETETLSHLDELVESYRHVKAGTAIDASAFTTDEVDALFYIEPIDDDLFSYIDGRSYKEESTIDRDSLRYIRILYYGFDEKTHIGELISNEKIAQDLKEIFCDLYKAKYQLEKVLLIDEYDADDFASMSDNNTSCFNYRNVPGTNSLSYHALGLAIDVNPRYNPYMSLIRRYKKAPETLPVPIYDGATPSDILTPSEIMETTAPYIEPTTEDVTDDRTWFEKQYDVPEDLQYVVEYGDRSKDFDHKITKDDYCCQLFYEHGFSWGGTWGSEKADYQHFEKRN